jgi:hypothetical protein
MLRRLRLFTVVTLFLWLVACGERACDVTGVWEGQAGDSLLVFAFKPDGAASISVTAHNQMSTTYCHWALLNRRISLTNHRGQARWFSIMECEGDEMLLRLDPGPAGLCRLRRTSGG